MSAIAPPRAAKAATPSTSRSSSRFPAFFRSSTGKKAVMAVSGAVLVIYLVLHMVGNLKIFLGRETFEAYATWLRETGEPALPGRTVLTTVEITLSISIIAHIWAAAGLARRAAKARPVKYAARRKTRADGYATHILRYGGITIALFVIWHLLDLTFGAVNPAGRDATPYARVVEGFAPGRWPVTVVYVLAVAMVGLHLRHGLWSAFQTLGLASGRSYRPLRAGASLVSLLLVVGFIAVPVAVLIGVVK